MAASAKTPSVSAIVLVAGESTRMGRQKALISWQGMRLIEYQLTQLSAIDDIAQIIVVTGHEPEAITRIASAFPKAATAHNARYATGKVSSILAGLSLVPMDADAIVLLAVDQPRPSSIVRELIARHIEGDASITVPVQDGRRGHPVVFARRLLPELLAISEDTQGIRAVIERLDATTHEVEFDDPIVHVDLNQPADLASDAPDGA